MEKNSNNGWNYRVVIEREPDIVNKGEWVDSYSFRDVYYRDGVPHSWGSDPQPAVGETIEFLIGDITLMAEALQKPPILVQNGELKGELSYSSQDQKLIKRFLEPYAKAMKVAEDSSDNIRKMFEKMVRDKANPIYGTDGTYTVTNNTTAGGAGTIQPIDLSYGQRQYLIEEKKRALQLEIDRAKMVNDTTTEKKLIEAYQRFMEDVKEQERNLKRYEF